MRAVMTRLGFSQAAAQAIVDEQGLKSLGEVQLMTDDEVESLCKVLRRPGGTVPGVGVGAAQVNNPGVMVNHRAEGHLKLLAFYLRHQYRVSCSVTPASITLDAIRTVRELREYESTYHVPSDDLPTINAKDWPKTMETTDEYLRSYLGERKIPLAYVIRKTVDLPTDETPTSYPTIQDEMIRRAPQTFTTAAGVTAPDPIYLVNRGKVWDIISKITRDHSAWTYVKPAQKTRDDRMAYDGLYQHFLGPNNVDNMATQAEDKLKNTVYNGEQRRWYFERYVNVHKQQHSIMEGLKEHGYTGIDPRSQVRYLLDGIKTDKFDAVKTRIMSDEKLRSDFDSCVTLYQDYIRQTSKTKTSATVNISEMKVCKRKFEAVEDRYYTKKEYNSLTPEQKKDLASKRLKRGHKPGAKDSKPAKSGGGKSAGKSVIKNLKAVERQVSQLAKQMGKTAVAEDDDTARSTHSDSSDDKPKAGSNRMNAALIRKKKVSISEKWQSTRVMSVLRRLGSLEVNVTESQTDLDSHADQCAVGSNSLIVHDYEKPINVSGYNPSGPGGVNLKTLSAALAYDDPISGETTILLVHQAIYIPAISHNLLSTMQVRLNDVIVNDTPRFLTDTVTDHTHSLLIPTETDDSPYVIPLSLQGVTSYFPTRKPTIEEFESLPHLSLTNANVPYDPADPTFAQQELSLTQEMLQTGDRIGAAPPSRRLCSVSKTRRLCSVSKTLLIARSIGTGLDGATQSIIDISPTLDDGTFVESLNISAIKSVRQQFDPDILARNWGIDRRTAQRTVDVTTQRGVRTVLHPTLSRRFRTNDRQLRYRRLAIDCFTDTLISNTRSKRGNSYAQIFATADGWCRAYPMEKKSEAHEGLSLLFQREGVPNTIIMDNAREQTMGLFRKKCRDAGVHVKQTEPHSPWSNSAEAAIRELKKGVGRQMVRSAAPKRLWGDCLEREAYVRLFTAHDIYKLNGQVPETIVSGETADISPLAQFKWYEWVMFRDTSVTYPDMPMVLGRDLGPAIDIGPAMTHKILKSNGKVVYRSTVRALSQMKWLTKP